MANRLTLFSRAGCHLCEDMEAMLKQSLLDFQQVNPVATEITYEVVYINNDKALQAKYDELVPVLKAGEKEICHYFLDVKALEQYISTTENPLK